MLQRTISKISNTCQAKEELGYKKLRKNKLNTKFLEKESRNFESAIGLNL